MRYRKKPVVIEAFLMTAERHESNEEWPEWLNSAWQKEPPESGALFLKSIETREFMISTLEGALQVTVGDWIIQGVQGEIYPCKPDIFEATYDAVVDTED